MIGDLRLNCRVGIVSLCLSLGMLLAGAKAADERPKTPAAAGSKTPAAKPSKTAEPKLPGDALAAGKVNLMQQEVVSGLKHRGVDSQFVRFCSFAGMKLNTSAGRYTGSELTGNCRLRWYDQLLRNPLKAAAEAEQFTVELHQAVLADDRLLGVLKIAREKMDVGPRSLKVVAPPATPDDALDALKQALIQTQLHYANWLAPLSKAEVNELSGYLYGTFVTQNNVGHTLNDRSTGRRLTDLLEKADRGSVHAAAETLAPLANPKLLDKLAAVPQKGAVAVAGATGRIVRQINTPGGAIVIGGPEKNTYQLDQMPGTAAVVDLGGDDEYYEGVAYIARPVLVVIDLAGDDHYRGTRPGVQGSGLLGFSMLLDRSGNDIYQAQDLAQGSALAGLGILVDFAGDDQYQALRRVQAEALAGIGLLLDLGGDDRYRASMWSQGFGAPLGFGLLDDVDGADHYYTGGTYLDSYPETPGMEGWGQGVGAGIRQVANGGIGVILDGGGDDLYEFDYLSHGGGYWCGIGFARDFGGSDQHLGSTERTYNGSPRSEPEFQRFGNGFGCHYSLGFLFDDAGDDVYRGRIMGVGFGWDCAVGMLFDFGGSDQYNATGMTTQGAGAQASLGVLFDYDGDDTYVGYGQGYANGSISYHPVPDCGGNFSFVIDYGGEDKYGCGARNNSYNQRGMATGFLIDRPQDEATAEDKADDPTAAQSASAGL